MGEGLHQPELDRAETPTARLITRHGFDVFEIANGYTVEDLYPVRTEPPVRLTTLPDRMFDAVLVRGPEMRARLGG